MRAGISRAREYRLASVGLWEASRSSARCVRRQETPALRCPARLAGCGVHPVDVHRRGLGACGRYAPFGHYPAAGRTDSSGPGGGRGAVGRRGDLPGAAPEPARRAVRARGLVGCRAWCGVRNCVRAERTRHVDASGHGVRRRAGDDRCWSTPWPGHAAARVPVHTLLLSGVIVSAVLGSMLMFLVSSVSSSEEIHNVVWWLLGNLQIFDWGLLQVTAAVVVSGLIVTMLFARRPERDDARRAAGGAPGAARRADEVGLLHRRVADDRRDGGRVRADRVRRADRAAHGPARDRAGPPAAGAGLRHSSALRSSSSPTVLRGRSSRRRRSPSAS